MSIRKEKDLAFNYVGFISRNRVAGSCGSSIFNILRNHQTIFHNGCNQFTFSQWCTRIPMSPYRYQFLLISGFLIVATLMGVRWLDHPILNGLQAYSGI